MFAPWEPRQFYDNVHVPEKSEANSGELEIPALESTLFPFQRRAVRWLLSREGMVEQPDGRFQPRNANLTYQSPHGFEKLSAWSGQTCHVNHALGVASTDLAAVRQHFKAPEGGILADEMGLGKTLEVIALICLHPRPAKPVEPSTLLPSSATLIITPPSILKQWKNEIQEHAPSLRVYHYQGLSSFKKSGESQLENLLDQDVVLTTYNVLAKEVHYVAEKPDRNLRNNRTREEPPKSPLTQVSWWRVCLDEAQMVESGVSAAATVARLIPRVHAWAVTGTPLRKGHRDLFGLLLFLGYSPWCRSPRLWDHLVTYYRPMLRDMLGEVVMRHSKDYVREDLRLPPQSRHTITIPFTPIEEQHYSQLFQDLCEDLDLDREGAPLTDDWDPESPAVVEKMRTWLIRLRQTCLHPEVGGRNRRALGRKTDGPLRTVEEVLDVMIDQHEGQLRTAQRGRLTAKIRRGQLKENAKASGEALKIWREAFNESLIMVRECAAQYDQARLSLGLNKDKGAGIKEKEGDDEANLRLSGLHARVRSALETHHVACFFVANALFQLKSAQPPESDRYQQIEKQETAAYEKAKSIRAELLKGVTGHVNKLVTTTRANLAGGAPQIPIMEAPTGFGGIESRKIFEKIHFYCEAMNAQAGQFHDLRQKMADFLSQALIDEDEGVELQGDEYESSTKHQDEMYAYMEALRALLADRTEAISGQENMLIKQEMKQFLSIAKEGEGPAPDVMLKLLAEREQKRVKVSEFGSLRGIIAQLRQMVSSLQWQESNNQSRASHELAILERLLKNVQELGAVQVRALTALEQEVNHFRDTMNSRLEYYRALQKLSDQVAPYREDSVGQPLDERLYQGFLADEARLQQKIDSISAKLRYLVHMKTDDSKSTAPRVCLICTDQFEVGAMTSCGHSFCKECFMLWCNQHHNCPVCKTRLPPNGFYDITYKPAEIAVQAESPAGSTASSPGSSFDRQHDQSIYSDISTTMLNQIKDVEMRGPSYGSKIDFLCRHLMWLREHDPGSKSIIFSQYREFIDVLARAFEAVKISCTRIDVKNGTEKFKSDPAVECFLLHAKAHSTGLNLVIANHVFLCEPLINTAIELQAIARVHRIGQHRATNVWMYLVADTVEESIYDISVTRRLAHMKTNSSSTDEKGKGKSEPTMASASIVKTPRSDNALQENAIDAANSMELQAADLSRLFTAGKSGGEMVDKEDLWGCLFGRTKRRDGGGLSALAESQPANTEVGRFLRVEAATGRAEAASERARSN
jgi:E3 ubiquitin-protein ligase SHPRH